MVYEALGIPAKTKNVEREFRKLGFNNYESRACVALGMYGPLSANQISYKTGIPKTKVYEVMNILMNRGIVGIIDTKPKQYRLVFLSESLNFYINEKKKEFEKKIKEMEYVSDEIKKIIPKLQQNGLPDRMKFISFFEGRKGLVKLWHSLLHKSKSEVLVFCGDGAWIKIDMTRLKALMKKGVDVKIITNNKDKKFIQEIRKKGIKIKYCKTDLRSMIVDKKQIYVSKKFERPSSKTPSGEEEDYSAILTDHKALVESLRELFYIKWKGE